MLPPAIEEKLSQIRRLVEESGAELLDISFRHYGHKGFVTIIADKQGGITLEECAAINHKLSPLFDEAVQGSYLLEVNSPGLDRPIRTEGEFLRVLGKVLKVFYKDATGRTLELRGELRGVTGGSAEFVRDRDGELVSVPIDSVVKAVREIKIK